MESLVLFKFSYLSLSLSLSQACMIEFVLVKCLYDGTPLYFIMWSP
jgi:hypothetical protein